MVLICMSWTEDHAGWAKLLSTFRTGSDSWQCLTVHLLTLLCCYGQCKWPASLFHNSQHIPWLVDGSSWPVFVYGADENWTFSWLLIQKSPFGFERCTCPNNGEECWAVPLSHFKLAHLNMAAYLWWLLLSVILDSICYQHWIHSIAGVVDHFLMWLFDISFVASLLLSWCYIDQ
jgi:hypothetical protein